MPEYLRAADAERGDGTAGLTGRPEIAIGRDHPDALPRRRDGELNLRLQPRPRSLRTHSWLQRQRGVLPRGRPAHDGRLRRPVQLDAEGTKPGADGPRPPAG